MSTSRQLLCTQPLLDSTWSVYCFGFLPLSYIRTFKGSQKKRTSFVLESHKSVRPFPKPFSASSSGTWERSDILDIHNCMKLSDRWSPLWLKQQSQARQIQSSVKEELQNYCGNRKNMNFMANFTSIQSNQSKT